MKIFSKFLVILGIILSLYTGYLAFLRFNPYRLSFESAPSEQKTASKSNPPKELVIDDLKINLPIRVVELEGKKWPAFENAVSYLSSSPIPGEQGNSILYGHNWTNLLGKLTLVKPGQKIKIVYPKNNIKAFQVEYTAIVLPKDVSILSQTKDHRITIYTCTGFLDSKRFVVVAKEV